MTDNLVEELKKVPDFADVPDTHLAWLASNSELKVLQAGEYLFKNNDPADYMYIILEGNVQMKAQQGNQNRYIADLEKGSITGLLPFSRMKVARVSGIASGKTVYLALHKSRFHDLISFSYELTQALVWVMTSRTRTFTQLQQQNEKMMALGKLSAGLAHELNNPAAAMIRDATELKKQLHLTPERFKKVISMQLKPEQVDEVNQIMYEKISVKEKKKLTLIERNGLEDEMSDWLEDHGVTDGYDIAETFVEVGLTLEDVEKISDILQGKHLEPVLVWICNNLNTERLVLEIEASADRISKLVQSVKTYSHMDRTPDRVDVDIHEGIESTLTMLNHKIKQKNITVHKQYQENFPRICVFVSELNQVWTNLIDNAIDAVEDNGALTIETRQDDSNIKVYIKDNGSGIPEDIIGSIFDPFFTTKPVGKGTGLGLDIVKKIIDQHNGSIKVKSQPGETTFEVCLPLKV